MLPTAATEDSAVGYNRSWVLRRLMVTSFRVTIGLAVVVPRKGVNDYVRVTWMHLALQNVRANVRLPIAPELALGCMHVDSR
jgi:hypothetical protein